MGDDIDADAHQGAHDRFGRRRPGVARRIEDMHAAEQRLMGVPGQHIELVFVTHHHVIAHGRPPSRAGSSAHSGVRP